MSRYLLSNNRVQILHPGQTLTNATIWEYGAWVDGEGLWVGCCDGSHFKQHIATLHLDGVLTPVGRLQYGTPLSCQFFQMTGDWQENWLGMFTSGGGDSYRVHRRLLYPEKTEEYRWRVMAYGGNAVRNGESIYDILVLTPRVVSGEGYNWYVCKFFGESPSDLDDQSYWRPVSPPIMAVADEPWLSKKEPGFSFAGGSLYYCFFSNGRYALYDHATSHIVHKDRWIDDFREGTGFSDSYTVYAKEFRVFLTLVWPDFEPETVEDRYKAPVYLRIYANEGDPTQVSAPVATPVPTSMTVSYLYTDVTGAQGDPVEDVPVNWGLTGAGVLSVSQSVTNAAGRASNTYIGPSVPSGDITITASTEGYY